MLSIFQSEGARKYRTLSFDPGANNVGIAITEMDLATSEFTVLFATTIKPPKLLDESSSSILLHGDIYGRMDIIRDITSQMLQRWQPNGVSIERAHFTGMVLPYRLLLHCITTIRDTVFMYDPMFKLFEYEASVVKTFVNVSGKSGDKELMTAGVLAIPKLAWSDDIDYSIFDEHAWDAIAIGYCHAINMLGVANPSRDICRPTKTTKMKKKNKK